MTMPFYASAEQIMRDRSEYARKGIARGRSVVVLTYADGILFVAENASRALHKVSEIYDRIAFAAVGKYNEFENMRVAGVRLADMRGYSYDRRDVTGRGLANAYAQTLGTIFTETSKPYEVEIVVAEHGFVAMGGLSDQIAGALTERYADGLGLAEAVALAVRVLGEQGAAEPRDLDAGQLEVAVLDRTRPGSRKFRRLAGERLGSLLAQGGLELPAEPSRRTPPATGA